jgi:hypothetical protein
MGIVVQVSADFEIVRLQKVCESLLETPFQIELDCIREKQLVACG